MIKYIKLPVRLNLVRHSEYTVLNIQFDNTAISEWCLALCLLKESLIENLLIVEARAKGKLEIKMLNRSETQMRAQASFEPEVTRLSITKNELDYLLHFFLKYYRDGLAEVDHLDLEVESANGCQGSSITFKVSESVEPLSADEARKRLEL